MKKRFKRATAVILTAAIAMTVSTPIFASTPVDDTEDIVAVVVQNGVATPFTEAEYDQYLKEQGRAITAKELLEGKTVIPDGQLPETVIENDTVANVMPRDTVLDKASLIYTLVVSVCSTLITYGILKRAFSTSTSFSYKMLCMLFLIWYIGGVLFFMVFPISNYNKMIFVIPFLCILCILLVCFHVLDL